MIHYHGTPITPRAELLTMAGRHFCVSHAEPRDVEACHEIGQTVMLDNGAFTMWTQGKPTDWVAFYEWADRWLDYPTTWAVIPDVIDGDEDQNDALIEEWPHGERGAPVWHLHESIGRFMRLCDTWPLVCLGSSGQYAKVGSDQWHARMAEAFDAVTDQRGRPVTRLHMLRGLALRHGPYPFYSADSVHTGRNSNRGRGRRRPKDRVAGEVDAQQPAPVWKRRESHLQLWTEG